MLQQTGYKFQSDQRLGIYLTNTLEEAIKRADTLFARWITEEANAAAEIKKEKPIMVVLGNPCGHVVARGGGEVGDAEGQRQQQHITNRIRHEHAVQGRSARLMNK